MRLDFSLIKLWDYQHQRETLENSLNPFASVILIALDTHNITQKAPLAQKDLKWQLTRRLYDKGLSKEQIFRLYSFLDWLVQLPEPLEIEYREALFEFEEGQPMQILSPSFEQVKQQGESTLLQLILE